MITQELQMSNGKSGITARANESTAFIYSLKIMVFSLTVIALIGGCKIDKVKFELKLTEENNKQLVEAMKITQQDNIEDFLQYGGVVFGQNDSVYYDQRARAVLISGSDDFKTSVKEYIGSINEVNLKWLKEIVQEDF